jgi:hypothetical protein
MVIKALMLATAAVLLATPAFAQGSDTLREVTTRGVVQSAGGLDVNVTYRTDGTFTAMDGQVTGRWRIDGARLCTTSNFAPAEECVAYPAGKKSGDSFQVQGGQGPATIKIR